MAVYVTLKCDGMMPPRSKERCRAGFSAVADTWIADDFGGLVADVDKVTDAAAVIGWTQDYDPNAGNGRYVQLCPSCTRHRAEGAA